MLKSYHWLWPVALLAAAALLGCGGPAATPTPSPTPASTPTVAAPTSTSVPTATAAPTTAAGTFTPTLDPTDTPTPEPLTFIRVEIGEGSAARYLVREQFADRDFPNDAVGETSAVSGALVFDGGGAVQADQSMLVVDLRTLRSDDADRDDYLLGESLESERFPFAEFVVQQTTGLPWPLPEEGESGFQLVGDMALHNTTSPLTWEVTAQFSPEQVTGTARTSFNFGTFRMVRPSRFFLLTVEDNIRLEIDFIASVRQLHSESSQQ